jgi:hypothetical protein
MSSYWGNVNGQRIVSGSLGIPLLGLWVADVVLSNAQALPTAVSLVVGNLTLAGAVYRQAIFGGLVEARIFGGAGGWHKTVQARAWTNPGGVLLSQVLRDAAIEVGESVNVAADFTIGNFFFRFGPSSLYSGKASRVLRSLAPSWWVDPNGVTQVGPRSSAAITSDFTTETFTGASGLLSIGTEDPVSWMPGSTFSSPQVSQRTIKSVRHELSADGRARLQVMAA